MAKVVVLFYTVEKCVHRDALDLRPLKLPESVAVVRYLSIPLRKEALGILTGVSRNLAHFSGGSIHGRVVRDVPADAARIGAGEHPTFAVGSAHRALLEIQRSIPREEKRTVRPLLIV